MQSFSKLKGCFLLIFMVSMFLLSSCKAKDVVETPKIPETPVSVEEPEVEEPEVEEPVPPLHEGENENVITYINSNYGFGVNSPLVWGEPIESDSGDGVVLLENEYFDVRVFASYMVTESDIETYMNTYYQGWEALSTELKGTEKAFKLEFKGSEETRKAVVAMADDKIYTFLSVSQMPLESFSEQEKVSYDETVVLIEQAMESFVVLD